MKNIQGLFFYYSFKKQRSMKISQNCLKFVPNFPQNLICHKLLRQKYESKMQLRV